MRQRHPFEVRTVTHKLRLALLIVGGLAFLAVVAFLGLYMAARHEPEFYREAMEIDPAVLEQASGRMLQQATALTGAVKREGRWEALFTAEQINGWLAVDMARNHPHTLPPALHDPRVAIDSKHVIIACRFEQGGASSVLSLTVEPYVPEPNVIALRIVRARAGLLPVPLGQVIEGLSRAARDMQFHLQWRSAGGDPVAMLSFPPTEDDRPVRIETLRLGEGEIYVAGGTQTQKP
jgi:hypothetical protein